MMTQARAERFGRARCLMNRARVVFTEQELRFIDRVTRGFWITHKEFKGHHSEACRFRAGLVLKIDRAYAVESMGGAL